jgi:hypothetical protein
MSEPQLKLSEVIDVRPAGPARPGAPSITLVKTATLEVRRLTLSKGPGDPHPPGPRRDHGPLP